ncbi:MAG: hypothetical protein ACETV1_08890, partial [Candidatus Bathyarchaeia archaeon]
LFPNFVIIHDNRTIDGNIIQKTSEKWKYWSILQTSACMFGWLNYFAGSFLGTIKKTKDNRYYI